MSRLRFAAAALVLFGTLGLLVAEDEPKNEIPAAVVKILDKAEDLKVYALDPKQKDKNGFRGFKIEGEPATIKDARVRSELVSQIQEAVKESDQIAPRTFKGPTRGIRATWNEKKAELLISFSERQAAVYLDGKYVQTVRLTDKPAKALDKALDR